MSEENASSSYGKLLDYVQQANDNELSAIVMKVINRYAELFPDTEVIFLSLPKNEPNERREAIEHFLKMTAIVFPPDS